MLPGGSAAGSLVSTTAYTRLEASLAMAKLALFPP